MYLSDLAEKPTAGSCYENETLSVFCEKLDLAFRANETDGATARVIHF